MDNTLREILRDFREFNEIREEQSNIIYGIAKHRKYFQEN